MSGRFTNQAVLAILLICQFSVCFGKDTIDPNDSSKYLDAVRESADNVLKYGRDTYGPKHTPLFVDGLMVRDPNNPNYGKDGVFKPVEWIAPNGDRWILSNLASQQNLFRTLDGLTRITGDPKYKQAAMDAIKYAFENLRSPNGLFYWGAGTAYDVQKDEVFGWRIGGGYVHCLKANFPYYELMWEVNSKETKRFIEAFWSAHILDWSNLDMNRWSPFYDELEQAWKHEYEGGPVFLNIGSGGSFISTGADLVYAAALLTKLSGDKDPLVWAKRLARRFVDTRHPKTGISYWMYTKPSLKVLDSYDDVMRKLVPGTTDFLCREFPVYLLINRIARECCVGQRTPTPGIFVNDEIFCHQIKFLIGEMLDGEGNEFKQWALEELTAYGKASYRKEDNVFMPIITDGTNLEGYLVKENGPLGPKGVTLEPYPVGSSDFWSYTMGYRVTRDEFMWEMANSIATGNNFGDIGTTPEDRPQLNLGTSCSDPYALLGFLELYRETGKKEFLDMAKRIGNNILSIRFHRGFFVASKKHIYTKFDAIDSLVLLQLHSTFAGDTAAIPQALPSVPRFTRPYRSKDLADDSTVLYALTEAVEPPISLNEAAATGNLDLVKSLIAKGAYVNNKEDAEYRTPLDRAVMGGHVNIVKLLIAEGSDVNQKDDTGNTLLHYAASTRHKDIIELLIAKGADVNVKNNQGQTPLDTALAWNRKDIVDLLIAKGATVESIHVAAQLGDVARVKAFLKQGIDVNAKNANGDTPLHSAVRGGYEDIAELLIAKGADINAKNNQGQAPLDTALA